MLLEMKSTCVTDPTPLANIVLEFFFLVGKELGEVSEEPICIYLDAQWTPTDAYVAGIAFCNGQRKLH